MKDLLEDINFAITKDNALEEEENVEMLQDAINVWTELIAQIHREREANRAMARRWEFNEATMAEFGLKI
jgi:hypothetical protein